MRNRKSRDVTVELNPTGLGDCVHPGLHRLGLRGSRVIYRADTDKLQTTIDPASGLRLFPIEEVFLDHTSVLIGCGDPNAAISVYRQDGLKGAGWYKYSAFMFWRQPAYIAHTKGRLQSGLYLELRGLPTEARESLWLAMGYLQGRRGPSCAKLNAEVLAIAGFTLGNGKPINQAIRPSRHVSLLWQHGIAYKGQPVDSRIVLTGDKGVGDHMKSTWLKEVTAPGRTVRKIYTADKGHVSAPVFDERQVDQIDSERWLGHPVTISVNRPSRLGANLTFLFGQQPVYTVALDSLGHVEELSKPLQPFPGKLDRVTKVKKHILFSRPVIAAIRRSRHHSVDVFRDIPAGAAIDMLTPSIGPDHDTAALYNCVVTLNSDGQGEARITPLKNLDATSQNDRVVKAVNWILAKHVLISGYDPQTVTACELWCYRNETGQLVVRFNDNSGTYKPDDARSKALEQYLKALFGLPVEYAPMNWSAEA